MTNIKYQNNQDDGETPILEIPSSIQVDLTGIQDGQVLKYSEAENKFLPADDEEGAGGGVTTFNGRAGAVSPQSGDYTKSDVGLGNLTNDAQLKRSANDFSTFTEKTTPVSTDIGLLEDSEASGVKKKYQLGNIAPMLGDNPSANAVTVTTPLPPQTLNDDDSFTVSAGQSVENGRVQAKLYKLVADVSGTTDIDIDFDAGDESLYVQQDSSKTDFVSGEIKLARINTDHVTLIHADVDVAPFTVDSYTKLLIHANGTNGSTTIVDDGGNIITANGNAQLSTAQALYGSSSILLDGTGDYLSASAHDNFRMGSGDFTIELAVYPSTSQALTYLVDTRETAGGAGLVIYQDSSVLKVYASGAEIIVGSVALTVGSWNKIRLERYSNVLYLYKNDVEVGYVGNSTNFTQGALSIGRAMNDSTHDFNGYIDEIRFSKGISRRFPILDSSGAGRSWTPVYVSQSETQKKFGNTSLYFREGAGAGAYISEDPNADFDFGTGDFTVEMDVYPTTISGDYRMLFNTSTTDKFQLAISNDSKLSFIAEAGAINLLSSAVFSTNAWQHVAITRNGNIIKGFVNGSEVFSTTYSGSLGTSTDYINIGFRPQNNFHPFKGYIDNIRVLKGTCAYTSSFTPPTSAHAGNAYDTNGYYVYTGATLELNLANVQEIDSIAITTTTPTSNTQVKGLISFDQGLTWKKWNGSAFTTVATASSTSEADVKSALNGVNWTSDGNTITELTTAHNNINVSAYSYWRIALWLKTSDAGQTPSISQVNVTYTMGTMRYDLVTGFRSATADAIVSYNDDQITVQNKINDAQDHVYLMNLIYY